MSNDLLAKDVEVEWTEFLDKFGKSNEIAKKRMEKVDLFPGDDRICFVLYKAFSPEECEFIMKSMEDIGFMEINYASNYRTNTRRQIHATRLAEEFFQRVREYLPERWPGEKNTSHWELVNVNDRIRVCRYEPGQFFAPHFDGIYKRSFMEQSQLTIMAYLNDEFTGGHTNFLDEKVKPPTVTNALKPETGMILIFQHDMFHEGEQLYTGKKYIMRSDVMYRRVLSEPISECEQKARDLFAEAERLEDASKLDEATQCYRRAYKLWPELEFE